MIATYSISIGQDGENSKYHILEDGNLFCTIDGASTDVLSAVRVMVALNLINQYERFKRKEDAVFSLEERLDRVHQEPAEAE